MPYQVRLGSLIAVTPGPADAITLFDDLAADYPDEVSIHDMDGRGIDIDALRQAAQDNSRK